MKQWLKESIVTTVVLVALAVPVVAQAECFISGHIDAAMTDDPMLPAYEYTLTVTWDMDSPYGLSHFDLMVDLEGGTCSCSDVAEALSFAEISGTSDGTYDCIVEYMAEIECGGDPSVPGVEGILVKFEPLEVDGCEPGNTGSGTFFFYSDLGPQPVDEEFLAMIDKGGQEYCSGTLTGVFPGLACDPVPTVPRSIDSMKSLFR